jgi:hypothetical protein
VITDGQVEIVGLKGVGWTTEQGTDVEGVVLTGVEVGVLSDSEREVRSDGRERDDSQGTKGTIVTEGGSGGREEVKESVARL